MTGFSGAILHTSGWGVDGGVSFNLPQFGAGDEISLTGSYTENAAWYSGLPDAMWGENGMVNGNGQAMAIGDTCGNPSTLGWATPKMWTVSSEVTHHFSPEFSGSLEGSYGQVRWSGTDFSSVVSDSNTWLAGVVAHWDPVKNLDFEFEVLYQYAHTDQPNGMASSSPREQTRHGIRLATASPPASKSPEAGNRLAHCKNRKLRSKTSGANFCRAHGQRRRSLVRGLMMGAQNLIFFRPL